MDKYFNVYLEFDQKKVDNKIQEQFNAIINGKYIISNI